jgi:predicted NBD/HSP70 family sugar kinase
MNDILFDIGGTKTRIALAQHGVIEGEPVIISTPKDFQEGMRAIRDAALACSRGKEIGRAGGGVAGTLSRDRGTLLSAPNLAGWKGKPIRSALSEAIGAPVILENDTSVVGLGEAVAGAGKGAEIVVYLTVSTGVGGARIVRGKIDASVYSFEPGHQIVDAGGALRERSVGGRGYDLEGLVSGTAIEARYGKKPYEIIDPVFWDEMARLLAYGVTNSIVHWSPDRVVIGGSMMKEIGIPIERVSAYVDGMLHVYPEIPTIVHSALGDLGGLHGALALLSPEESN